MGSGRRTRRATARDRSAGRFRFGRRRLAVGPKRPRAEREDREPRHGERRRQRRIDGGVRQRCHRAAEAHDHAQHQPGAPTREPRERVADHGQRQRRVEQARERGHRAEQHGNRHERHDQDVGDRRDERQALEVDEDDGQRRELRGERQRHRLADPGRPPSQPPFHRRSEPDQPGRGQQRELEPDVPEHRWGDQQHEQRRKLQGRCGMRPRPAHARDEHAAGHERRADDRWTGAGEQDVARDGCRRHGRAGPSAAGSSLERPSQRRHQGGDDRDVPAGDRHDVGQAGGREGIVDLRRDRRANAEQDSGAERRLGLGDDRVEPAQQRPTRAGQERAGARCVRHDLGRARTTDRSHPLPGQVFAVGEAVEVLGKLELGADANAVAASRHRCREASTPAADRRAPRVARRWPPPGRPARAGSDPRAAADHRPPSRRARAPRRQRARRPRGDRRAATDPSPAGAIHPPRWPRGRRMPAPSRHPRRNRVTPACRAARRRPQPRRGRRAAVPGRDRLPGCRRRARAAPPGARSVRRPRLTRRWRRPGCPPAVRG